MLSLEPIGYVRSPYRDTQEIPKGLGAKHEAEGVLEIRTEFEAGLRDIEGFSHLFVIWAFDRSEGYTLVGTPPSDNRPHGVFATRSPRRPNPIGLTVVELLSREGPVLRARGIELGVILKFEQKLQRAANPKLFQQRNDLLLRLSEEKRVFTLKCGHGLNRVRAADGLRAGLGKAEMLHLSFSDQIRKCRIAVVKTNPEIVEIRVVRDSQSQRKLIRQYIIAERC